MALPCYASHDLKEIGSRSLLSQTSPSHRDTILMRGRPMLQWFPRSTRSHVLKTRLILMHIQCTRARSRCLRARAQLTRSASGATCGAGATPGAAASSWLVMAASSEYLLNLWTSAFSEAEGRHWGRKTEAALHLHKRFDDPLAPPGFTRARSP